MNSLQAKKAKDKEMISYFLSIIKTLKQTPIISSESINKNIVLDPYETYISLIDKKVGLILKNLPYLLILLDTKQVYRIYFISKYLTENPMSDFTYIFKLDMDDQELDDKLFYYVGNFSNMIPMVLINFKTYLKNLRMSIEPSDIELLNDGIEKLNIQETLKPTQDDIKIVKYSYRMNGCPVRCLDPTPYVKEIEWL
jgi:hypothetical protein